jgi:hypothetical protein
MVTKALFDVLFVVPTWLLSIFPTYTLPAWVGEIPAQVGGVVGYMEAMGNWIPVEHFAPAFGLVLISVGVAAAVKIARIVASFVTLGGGSAA